MGIDDNDVEKNILKLIEKMEKHYNIKFNFDNKFFQFPNYKESRKYSDLSFNI